MKLHPKDSLLQELLAGPRKRLDPVLKHVETCTACQARLDRLDDRSRFRRPAGDADYEPALDHAYKAFNLHQAVLDRERSEAPQLLARLLSLIPGQQQLLLRNSRRFRTWGLVEILLQCGENETFVDPVHAEAIFELALNASTYLDTARYGKERIEDIRARALGYIANTYRIRMELSIAEDVLREAFLRLQKGTDDIMERAHLFVREASLRRAQRRLDEALRASDRAVAIFVRSGEDQEVGKALVTSSSAYHVMGALKEARSVLRRALDLIDPVREPRVALCALHNLIDSLASSGRPMEARKLAAQARSLYRRFPEPRVESRRRWVEGKIAQGLGRREEATELLRKARGGFISAGANFEAALVLRDLSSLAQA